MRADSQRYASVRTSSGRRAIRCQATNGTFAADITLDSEGIVIDYPGIALRLSS